MKSYLLLALSCFLLVLAACKKNGNDDAAPTEKPVLSFTKNAYTPYEVAILQADKDFTADQIAASIEGTSVGIALLDSNRLGLLIPALSTGKHTLVIESDIFQNDTVSFTIGNYTPVADPAQTITHYMDGFDGQIKQLQHLKDDYGVDISPENINELKAMQQALSDAVAAATQEEKEALAQFIEANPLMSVSMDNFPYRDSFYAKTVTDPGDELMAIGKTFVLSTLSAAAIISAYVACASVPDPGISKIMALAAGGSALAVIVYARNVLWDRLTGCLGKAADFIWDGELMKTTDAPLSFTGYNTVALIDNLKFRNLQSTDISENNYIHTIVSKANTFAGYWEQLQDGIAKLKSWFSGVPDKISGGPVEFSAETYKAFPAKQEYLSVNNVSDDRIQLSIIDQQGEKRIKATTTETLEEETPFTFDITYKHPDLGNSVTKTVQGVFKDNNSGDIFSDAAAVKAIRAANGLDVSDPRWNSSMESEVIAVLQENGCSIDDNRISELTMKGLGLTVLPPEIGDLTHLIHLNFDANELTSIPAEVGLLTNLNYLNINWNQLTSIPMEIGGLTHLVELNLLSNQLTSIPSNIGNLTNLEVLLLSENQLSVLPAGIWDLPNLTTLDVESNQLTTIPSAIGNLATLTDLNLSDNQLATIPSSIGNLNKLEYLSIGYNQLSTIPSAMGSLLNLISLDCTDNLLTAVPPQIGSLTNLTYLSFQDNQLMCLPPSVWAIDPTQAIINYSGNSYTLNGENYGLCYFGDTDCSNNPCP